MAKGRYLGYLSADDIIYPHCLSEIAAHISDTPKILYPDYDLISADTSFIRQIKTAPTTTKKLIEELECTPGLAAFFPASLFKQTGGWRTDLVYIPDYEFWLRLFRAGAHFTRVPQSLGGFRIHAGSGSVRAISYERSEEIIALAQEYGQLAETRHGYRIARQNAYLIAARSHFQSARYLTGLARWFEACRIGPLRNILRPSKLRFILAGLLRRFVIGLKE